jgi:hypothetical protein
LRRRSDDRQAEREREEEPRLLHKFPWSD